MGSNPTYLIWEEKMEQELVNSTWEFIAMKLLQKLGATILQGKSGSVVVALKSDDGHRLLIHGENSLIACYNAACSIDNVNEQVKDILENGTKTEIGPLEPSNIREIARTIINHENSICGK